MLTRDVNIGSSEMCTVRSTCRKHNTDNSCTFHTCRHQHTITIQPILCIPQIHINSITNKYNEFEQLSLKAQYNEVRPTTQPNTITLQLTKLTTFKTKPKVPNYKSIHNNIIGILLLHGLLWIWVEIICYNKVVVMIYFK